MQSRVPTYSLIILSVLFALLLDIYPLPFEYRILRPQFVLLVVIYWIFILPQGASLLLLLVLGVLQDVISGAPIGQHPLMLMPLAYLCLRSYRRARHFSRWQEVLWVFILVAAAELVAYWVQSLLGRRFSGFEFLLPALASALVWPGVALALDGFRRRYRISRQV